MADVPAAAAAPLRPNLFWPGLVLLLLGGQVLLMLVMVFLATMDDSLFIEPDYYQKSLDWDKTAAQLRENSRLGWSVRLDLANEVSVLGERTVTLTLLDAARQPVDEARIELVAFPHVRGRERMTVTLSPAGDGVYVTSLRFARQGVWEFRFTVRGRDGSFTQTVIRDVQLPRRS